MDRPERTGERPYPTVGPKGCRCIDAEGVQREPCPYETCRAELPAKLAAGLHVRKVIAEYDPSGLWRTLDMETGDVAEHISPQDVLRAVKRADVKAAKAGQSTVTQLEWRNYPTGFTPPSEV